MIPPSGVTYKWDSGQSGSILVISSLPYPTYGVDTSQAEYAAPLKPQDTHHDGPPWGGYPKVYLNPIYPISPTISIISSLYYVSAIIQDRELWSG